MATHSLSTMMHDSESVKHNVHTNQSMCRWLKSITTGYNKFQHVLVVPLHAHHPHDEPLVPLTVWQRHTDTVAPTCHCNAIHRHSRSLVYIHTIHESTAMEKVNLNSVTGTVVSLCLHSHLCDDVQRGVFHSCTVLCCNRCTRI